MLFGMALSGGLYPGMSKIKPRPIAAMIDAPGISPISSSASVPHLGQHKAIGRTLSGRLGHSNMFHVFMTFRLTVVDMG